MEEILSGRSMGAILLAAGASRRMGTVKQLLPWKNSTLLEYSIEQLKQAKIDSLVVVLGAHENQIRENTVLDKVDVVVNPDWQKGMATSIAAGVNFLLDNTPDLERILVALSDQPLLDSKYYNKLTLNSLNKKNKIICSTYSGQSGVPAVFPRDYFDDLLNLEGDKGARALLRGGSDKMVLIKAGERAIDLDTQESYNRLYDIHGRL
ncbi:MAG: nucleotidyltransferase family protein [Lutimonas sp.]